ncbi:MAG: hypothetical protein A2672_01170 [Candidatus Wildermuthbacteria bacterium RIFCSPHIGHO2_01_FULL_49_22b]|uniref:DUF378 domain-containing protein n=1 Tax=Candidatus Wildermuthbacteria bacterium RIFCSPHIGHO2_01_FULL_49_22b TaxID=1802448 RepID=A0A1G2QZQ8_9BACT|nr:MAG: hypothetical protein A2672_01170 [Candidatus Wildermuthbacteria bacterium RIFCSPHIGHO2_01_FULL_49_22b]
MKFLHGLAFVLVIIGGLNWLIFGLFQTELGTWIGGMDSPIARIIYVLVGLAAIYKLVMHKKMCRMCGPNQMGGQM